MDVSQGLLGKKTPTFPRIPSAPVTASSGKGGKSIQRPHKDLLSPWGFMQLVQLGKSLLYPFPLFTLYG
jgi:hypothetical protein